MWTIIWAIKQLRHLFYGIKFEILTDHQPLVGFLSLSGKVSRVQRWSDFLSAYQYLLHYRPAAANANADVLSRLAVPMEKEIPECAITDPDDVDIYFAGASGLYRRSIFLNPQQQQDVCHTSRTVALLWVGSGRPGMVQD